jgi:sugar O-acyltransferase (sialic acid O-acetyltransferase NeuD family)
VSGARVVVFGTGSLAEIVRLHLGDDTDHQVVAFTATSDRIAGESFSGLPLVPFEHIAESHPPSKHRMFVAVGYDRVNRVRSRFYGEAKAMGYELLTYVSSTANVRSASIGDNCCVFDGAILEPFSTIGNDVIVWAGAQVCHHSSIGDHSFLAPGSTVAGHVSVGSHCFLGANATVRDGISIGEGCLIGAGANVLRSTAPGQVLVGDRARPYPGDARRFFGEPT